MIALVAVLHSGAVGRIEVFSSSFLPSLHLQAFPLSSRPRDCPAKDGRYRGLRPELKHRMKRIYTPTISKPPVCMEHHQARTPLWTALLNMFRHPGHRLLGVRYDLQYLPTRLRHILARATLAQQLGQRHGTPKAHGKNGSHDNHLVRLQVVYDAEVGLHLAGTIVHSTIG